MRVKPLHQVLASAAPHDAVTTQAFTYRKLLREWGRSSEIIAENVHPRLSGEVLRLDEAERLLEESATILRYSIWTRGAEVVLSLGQPLGLWYHNVTPAPFLVRFNPDLVALSEAAARLLPRFRTRCRAIIADSRFNAEALAAAGLPGAVVVPLLLSVEHRPGIERDVRRPLVITVGRIAPNKRLEDVIKVFFLYRKYNAPDARLAIVGSDAGFESYSAAVKDLARLVGVRNVTWTGEASDAERDALYQRASAYLCMSEHEGFCAPLVEAMAHGVPIVARHEAAVPETLAGAGLAIEGADLPVYAEALHEVVSSPRLREDLMRGAAARLAQLSSSVVAEQAHHALLPLLAA
jgi:glycosyltransferase involved in cell wall biosynthesis